MFDIFSYDFMVRALAAGLLAAVTLPVLGAFLVARRYALIADSLAHVSLVGVGAGLLLGIAPIGAAAVVTVLGALLLEWLRRAGRLSGDVSLAILMSGGLALAVVLARFGGGASVDFNSYLFGSISTTTPVDVWLLLIGSTAVLAVVAKSYRSLMHIAFDEAAARVAGVRVNVLNYLLVGMTAMMVVLSLRVIGGLLVGALLVIPVVAAAQLARSFLYTIIIGVTIAALSVVIGLTLSFYLGIASGAAIVLAALSCLGITLTVRR